jgi:hypothetical protein
MSTSQSGEASSSKQCPQDQSQQFQNTSNPSAALPCNVPGVVGSETNTQDLENSLQKAEENFSSKQCPQDQSQQFQNTSNPSAALPCNVPGVVGSETNTQDLENSLQKAEENFIRSQIEVQRFLIP